jgi:hypothetical protein
MVLRLVLLPLPHGGESGMREVCIEKNASATYQNLGDNYVDIGATP